MYHFLYLFLAGRNPQALFGDARETSIRISTGDCFAYSRQLLHENLEHESESAISHPVSILIFHSKT